MSQRPEVAARKPSSSICKSQNPIHRNVPQTSLQALVHLGIPKPRAEKALAATGDRGPQVAFEWLLNHASDPVLDDSMHREYILYLCPTGPLLDLLDKFYSESLRTGFNSAHNYLPHITLCSFFQAPDEAASLLVNGLEHCVEKMKSDLPTSIRLEHFNSAQFIGLFLNEEQNDVFKRLANMFMRECSEFISGGELGPMHVISTCFPWCSSYPLLNPRRIEVEPYLKSLHLTLAYQFEEKHRDTLKRMAESIVDPLTPAFWELRLYSRDPRVKGNEVHQVIAPHEPVDVDELRLIVGDYIYVSPEALKASTDGWVEGTSWLSGCTGQVPTSTLERSAESAVWTLHKNISLSSNMNGCARVSLPNAALVIPAAAPDILESHPSPTKPLLPPTAAMTDVTSDARKLIVVRHGERIDFTFGHGWIPVLFSADCVYQSKDLNQPASLPAREDPFDYQFDSPLTVMGLHQATLTGTALRESGTKVNHVYVSPSFRCIQTATNIVAAMETDLQLNIEPGLFEWMTWYQSPSTPKFMSIDELIEHGFNINSDYVPIMTTKQVLAGESETLEDFYKRSHVVTNSILSNTSGNILIVAHAGSLDTCIRELTGELPRTPNDFLKLIRGIPYCGVSMIQQESDEPSTWLLTKPPIRTLQHSSNQRYDWRTLMN